ncbi:hypothetical protein ADILRU_2643 [Leifsonia rubra CMS 76R]|nr:hypothetical protein ADILRU_2643 [Leifsonia rubra CMS 76R]
MVSGSMLTALAGDHGNSGKAGAPGLRSGGIGRNPRILIPRVVAYS